MTFLSETSRRRTIFIWITVTAAVVVILATREVLLPFVLASVIAYVLAPAVALVERARLPRWIAVIVVYAVTLGGIYEFFALVTPRLVRELGGLHQELPALSVRVRDEWTPAIRNKLGKLGLVRADEPQNHEPPAPTESALKIVPNRDGSYDIQLTSEVEIRQTDAHSWRLAPVGEPSSFDFAKLAASTLDNAIAYGRRNTLEVVRFGSSIVAGLSTGIFKFFLTLMLAAYIMITREKIFDFFRALVKPTNRRGFDHLLARLDRGLAGVVRGQLFICAVNGVLTAAGFSLIGLKYWPILSLVAAVMSIIPIFGSILSSIPAVAIGLTQGFGTGLFALAWIVGIHQIEANILNPKIYGVAAKIHPVLVIFSLLAGEHFFSLAGALLAVPCMSIVQNIFIHFRGVSLGADAPTDSFVPPPLHRR